MGICLGREAGAGPTSVDDCVAAVFHNSGIFLVGKDGGYSKAEKMENWWRSSAALQCGEDTVLVLHDGGTFRVQLPTGEAAKVGSDSWVWAGPMVRTEKEPEKLICFHDMGTFAINSADGSSAKLSDEKWRMAKGVVYFPLESGVSGAGQAMIFHDHGTYRVDLGNGKSEKLNGDTWINCMAAIYDEKNKAALVIGEHGVYRVNPTDGSNEKISSTWWVNTVGAVYVGDGMVMIFHNNATYILNTDDGSYEKLNDEMWMRAKAVTPVGQYAWASMHAREAE